jgi:hypothetical protein
MLLAVCLSFGKPGMLEISTMWSGGREQGTTEIFALFGIAKCEA